MEVLTIAERRMFHSSVVESDGFLDLPVSSQALYFHLGMHADDDGFINGPKQVARSVGCSLTDLQTLVESKFLLQFDDVVVIRHWRIANSVRTDRLRMPRIPEIAKKIYLKEDRTYTTDKPKGIKNFWADRKMLLRNKDFPSDSEDDDVIPMDSKWIPLGAALGNNWNPKGKEVSRNKKRLKEVKENELSGENAGIPDGESPEDLAAAHSDRELKYMKGNLGKGVVLLSEDQIASLLDTLGLDAFDHYVEKLAGYILKHNAQVKNHYATIMKWWQEDRGVF